MYKVIIVDALSFSGTEEELNAIAEEGYRYVGVIQMQNRAMLIMEKKQGPGRPKKQTEENMLGE